MARSRGRSRGPGFPALGGTLGTLLRSTLAQAGAVKDVIERSAREGKHRLDDARRERRREQALARLGEAVLDALHAGEAAELLERREIADALAELDDLDQGEDRREDWVAPPTRERYDRGPAPRRGDAEDDGTVSSATWRPPAAARAPVWRPPGVEPRDGREGREGREGRDGHEPHRGEPEARAGRRPGDEPGARFQERRRPGGIQFEDDDSDLAEYMHPDDLPGRPPGKGG